MPSSQMHCGFAMPTRDMCCRRRRVLWSVAAMRGGRPEYDKVLLERGPWRPALNSAPAEAMEEKRPVQIADIRETSSFTAGGQTTIAAVELGGLRTVPMVPMIADEKAIGMIVIYRTIVRPSSTSRLHWLRISRSRPLSPSRTRGCSTSCVNLLAAADCDGPCV